MRRNPTPAEARLWSMLRGKRMGGWKFKRQFPIGPYIADFACTAGRLIVEADGSQHVDSEYDLRRDAYLQRCGFWVLRFWNSDILRNADGVHRAIEAALGPPRSLPRPAPPASGGALKMMTTSVPPLAGGTDRAAVWEDRNA